MNPGTMIRILYQMNVSSTLNNPICYDKVKIPAGRIRSIIDTVDKDSLTDQDKERAKQIYIMFINKWKGGIGSVHINSSFWYSMVIKAICDCDHSNFDDEQLVEIEIPNGCCSKGSSGCPISLYYEMTADFICSL